MSNFSNIFPSYISNLDYEVNRNAMIEQDEGNAPYANYTIGYGYDISTHTGSQIISDFTGAGIFTSANTTGSGQYAALYSALQSYGSGGTNNTGFSAVNNAFAADLGGGLTTTQAVDLLDWVAPTYENTVSGTAALYDLGSYPTSNNGLHTLLFSEDYNGGNIFGATQADAISADNTASFIDNVLFFNNKVNGAYSQGLENRRVYDLATSLGLSITATSSPYIVTDINFGNDFFAAFDVAEAVTEYYSTIPTNLISFATNLLNDSEPVLISNGVYVAQQGDTWASVLTGPDDSTPDVDVMQRINAVFGLTTTLEPGDEVHLPSDSGLDGILVPFQTLTGITNVYDVTRAQMYPVGTGDQLNLSGWLIIDQLDSKGNYPEYAAGTYSGVSMNLDGTYTVNLITGDPIALGSLTLSSSGNGILTLPSGATLSVSGLSGAVTTAPTSDTALQTLVSYLSDLGSTATASTLNTANITYLNPTGTAYTVTGTVSGSTDTFSVTASSAAGAHVTGASGKTNILNAAGDVVQDSISNVQQLNLTGALTLTGSEWSGFTSVTGSGSLTFASSGSFSASGIAATISAMTAQDWGGTTLTGSNANSQTLTASVFGNDTLNAGNGTGDTLVAGEGTDTLNAGSGGDTLVAGTGVNTLTGGSGNDIFKVGYDAVSGTSLNGESGVNLLQITAANANVALATISNITSLEIKSGASTTLMHSQFTGFTTFTADSGAGSIGLSDAETYSLASDTVTGALTLTATGSGNYTLTGNNTAYQTINGNSGSDTIATGTGTEDTVNANGTGDFVTLNGTYGTANINDASGAWTNVNGANDLVNDYGSGDTIDASGTYAWINSNGGSQSITTTSTSSYDTVNINGSSTWANITGNNDTIDADGSYDNVTLNGSTDWVYIDASYVTVALDGSSGNVTAVTGASSTNAWINMNANNNVVTLNGTDGSATASSGYSNDWINVNGTGNVATLSGTGDTAYLTGTAEDAWVNVGGSGNGTNGSGTGNTFNITASSNTVGGGDDTFIVANGLSETLNGGESDLYELGSTFGNIGINNLDFGTATTANGKLTFGSGVTDENLWFQQSGNNLLIDLLDTTDQITVDNWFGSNAGAQLSEIDAGSLKLTTASQVQALVSAMAYYSSTTSPGFNPQTAGPTMPSALSTALAASWHS